MNRHARAALIGVNASVVGLLLATLYEPVWTGAISHPTDFAVVMVAFAALMFWKLPPWLVVSLCAAGGWVALVRREVTKQKTA